MISHCSMNVHSLIFTIGHELLRWFLIALSKIKKPFKECWVIIESFESCISLRFTEFLIYWHFCNLAIPPHQEALNFENDIGTSLGLLLPHSDDV